MTQYDPQRRKEYTEQEIEQILNSLEEVALESIEKCKEAQKTLEQIKQQILGFPEEN